MLSGDEVRRGTVTFVMLSFEGPDPYSHVGKLGERVTNLAEALAHMGFETHLLFIGDPNGPGHETVGEGKLHLHRWCQWISRYHPQSTYEAEEAKLSDLNKSAPPFVVNEIIRQSLLRGKPVVVQGEEWHCAEAVCRIAELADAEGLGEHVLTLWNVNDVHSINRVDWPRLARRTTITTVSKYMKHVLWNLGVNPLVIPNGISERLLLKGDERKAALVRKAFEDRLLLVKFADWHPGKRWRVAVEAVASLKAQGKRSVLIAGGESLDDGSRRHEAEIVHRAKTLGLEVAFATCESDEIEDQIAALVAVADADIIRVAFPVSEELVRLLYSVGDGVLADSDHEAFGLQALEVMAAGGVAFTGCTGEEYAEPLVNAMVLETGRAEEIVEYTLYLDERKDEKERVRLSARMTAHQHTWEEVAINLIGKVEYLLRSRAAEHRRHVMVPQTEYNIPLPLSTSTLRSLYQSRSPHPPNIRAS